MKLVCRLCNQKGTTLIELIVASSLLSVVLASTYFTFATAVTTYQINDQNTKTYEIARRSLNEIGDNIRRAELPLIHANKEIIIFNLDLIPSIAGSERVTFRYVENGPDGKPLNIVRKSIFRNTGTLISETVVATNVINKLIFKFYDKDHSQIIMPDDVTSVTYRDMIKQIKTVHMTANIKVEDLKKFPKDLSLESEVNLRNAP